jgi:hypothetical protein
VLRHYHESHNPPDWSDLGERPSCPSSESKGVTTFWRIGYHVSSMARTALVD